VILAEVLLMRLPSRAFGRARVGRWYRDGPQTLHRLGRGRIPLL